MKATLPFNLLFAITFSSHADVWIQKTDFGGNGRENAVGFSISGKGYIGTGSAANEGFSKTFWEYDPITNSWSQKADLAGDGRESAIGFSIDVKGYIGLGQIEDCCYIDDFWEYDPELNQWTQKATFPGGKRGSAFAFAIGGKGYVGSGGTNSIKKRDFWEYDPLLNSWTIKSNYEGGQVTGSTAFVIDSKAYVGTGRDDNLDYKNDFWEYDPVTDIWTQKGNFAGGARTGSIGFSIGGVGYLGLGTTLDTSFSDFWQYNPLDDSWTQKSNYPGGGAADRVGFAIENKGYCGTGGFSEKQFYQYSPDCTTPINLTSSNLKSTTAKVSWNLETSAQTYSVRYRKTGTTPWSKTTAQINYKKLTGLSPDTQYDWAVKSVCDPVNSISSDWSATKNFTTKPLKLGVEVFEPELSVEISPNPFSYSSAITFSCDEPSHMIIELWDLSGRNLITILDQDIEEGNHEIELDGEEFSEGIYFLRIQLNDLSQTMKVIIQ